jgi:hypothetical protein
MPDTISTTRLPRSIAEQIAAVHRAAVERLGPLPDGLPPLRRCYDLRAGSYVGTLDGSEEPAIVERVVILPDNWAPSADELAVIDIDAEGRVVRQIERPAPPAPTVDETPVPTGPAVPLAPYVVDKIIERHNRLPGVVANRVDGLPKSPSAAIFPTLHACYAAASGDLIGGAEDADVAEHLDRCVVLADDEPVAADDLACFRVTPDGIVVTEGDRP